MSDLSVIKHLSDEEIERKVVEALYDQDEDGYVDLTTNEIFGYLFLKEFDGISISPIEEEEIYWEEIDTLKSVIKKLCEEKILINMTREADKAWDIERFELTRL